jgi:5-methylcytosine-specific restriction endonuclease McrA
MPLRCCPLGHVRPYGEPCPQCGSRPHRERSTRPSLGTQKWRELARYVKYRDGACVNCGEREDLVAHHVVPACEGGVDDPTNLVTLCRSCHGLAHSKQLTRFGTRTPPPAVAKRRTQALLATLTSTSARPPA